MSEVEILEPINTDKFLYSKVANIKKFVEEVPVATINGQVVETQKIEQFALCCPECETVIIKFSQGISRIDITKAFMTDDEEIEKSLAKHCPNCGQKLSYKRTLV